MDSSPSKSSSSSSSDTTIIAAHSKRTLKDLYTVSSSGSSSQDREKEPNHNKRTIDEVDPSSSGSSSFEDTEQPIRIKRTYDDVEELEKTLKKWSIDDYYEGEEEEEEMEVEIDRTKRIKKRECKFCKYRYINPESKYIPDTDHETLECENCTVWDKNNVVYSERLCRVCLESGHETKECPQPYKPCPHCYSNHHPVLCFVMRQHLYHIEPIFKFQRIEDLTRRLGYL